MALALQIRRNDGQIVDVVFDDKGEQKNGVFVTDFVIDGKSYSTRYKRRKGETEADVNMARECEDMAFLYSMGFELDDFDAALDRALELRSSQERAA